MKKEILFSLMLLLCGCNNTTQQNICETIDVAEAFDHLDELSVNDLGKTISYVPLETSDESLIGKNAYIRLIKDKLLVGSFQQPVKMFDRKTGKFIKNVGAIGQGANEYEVQNSIPVFWIDEVTDIIYVESKGGKVVQYDKNGEPLGNIHFPDSFPQLTDVSQITMNDKMYTYKQPLFGKTDYKIYTYDMKNKEMQKCLVNKDEEFDPNNINSIAVFTDLINIPVSSAFLMITLKDNRKVYVYTDNPNLWSFDQEVYLKENFNDTIYLLKDNNLIPDKVFNLGDKHLNYEERYEVDGNKDKISIDYILEGDKAMFFIFQTNYYGGPEAKSYWGVYNKNDKSVKITDKLQIADLNNGVFNGKLQTSTIDGKLVGVMEAPEFIEKNGDKYDFKLTEEDNPVAVIIE